MYGRKSKTSFVKLLAGTAFLFSVFLLVSSAAQAQNSATASATIVSVAEFTTVRNLSFGQITPDALAESTVRVAAVDGVSLPDMEMADMRDEEYSAMFEITGAPRTEYSVLLASSSVELAGVGMGMAMTLSGLTVSNMYGTLDDSGIGHIYIGGTLTIPAELPIGEYFGEFIVTTSYP